MTNQLRHYRYTLPALAIVLTFGSTIAQTNHTTEIVLAKAKNRAVVRVGPGLEASATLGAERIAQGLYRIESTAGSNVLALRGGDGALLVDAGPADGVELLQATLDSLDFPPVTHVVITHYHDDHLAGAAWFRERGAVVLAHPNTNTEAAKDTIIAEWGDWHRQPADDRALPDSNFNDEAMIQFDANVVRAFHQPRAHTSGDVIVSFENLAVVHTGDVYEVGAYPFIDHWAGGTAPGMISAMNRLLGDFTSNTRYVPGHGPVGGQNELRHYRDMLIDVCRRIVTQMRAGSSVEAVLETQPTERYDDTSWGAPRHGRQLAALMFWSLEAISAGPRCEEGSP